jgi:hypothetical protein
MTNEFEDVTTHHTLLERTSLTFAKLRGVTRTVNNNLYFYFLLNSLLNNVSTNDEISNYSNEFISLEFKIIRANHTHA